MTKEYDRIDPHDALYIAAREYPGGIAALAHRMSISEPVLRNKLSPDIDTHHMTVRNFIDVIELLDPLKPAAAEMAVGALMWRLNRMAVRLPSGDEDIDANKILQRMLEIFKKDGDLANAINRAFANDKVIDDREHSEIEQTIQSAIDGLVTLRNEVREKHQRDAAGQ